jgi:hypothetical protein
VTAVTLGAVARSYSRRGDTVLRREVDVEAIRQASLAGLIGVLVSVVPMVLGIAFAVRPNERRLAMMRPASLAGIFAAIANVFLGITNALVWVARAAPGEAAGQRLAQGLAEASVLPFIGFVCLTVGWLSVTIGMRKQQ